MLNNLKIKQWVILAVIIRFLLMPFFYHPDIKTTNFKVSFLKQGVVDIYAFLDKERSKFTIPEDFNYFPLTYFFLGGYQVLTSPLLGDGFSQWLNDASQNANERIGVFRYLFILKLPYLILDLGVAWLVMGFFAEANQKKKALLLWLFNPFTLGLIYIYSNIDIIPVFLTTLSLLFAHKKKLLLSALFLGLGASFKAYPLLLLPFLLLESNNIKEKLAITAASLGVFLLTIIPFYFSPGFKESALTSGLTTRILSPGIGIGFGETLIVGIIALSALLFYGLVHFQKRSDDLINYTLAFLLLLLSFIHFHIQWILWLLPLMILLWVKNKITFNLSLWILLIALMIPWLYEDKFMTVSLLTAVSLLYSLVPIPFAFVQKVYDPYVVQSVLQSALIGGSLIFVLQLVRSDTR